MDPAWPQIYAETTGLVRELGGDAPVAQDIYVLRGGFGEFQALYKVSWTKCKRISWQ